MKNSPIERVIKQTKLSDQFITEENLPEKTVKQIHFSFGFTGQTLETTSTTKNEELTTNAEPKTTTVSLK